MQLVRSLAALVPLPCDDHVSREERVDNRSSSLLSKSSHGKSTVSSHNHQLHEIVRDLLQPRRQIEP